MISISEALSTLFEQAINEAYPDLTDPPVIVSLSNNAKLGDYQCNSALPITKLLAGAATQGNFKMKNTISAVNFKIFNDFISSQLRKTKNFTKNYC